MLKIYVHVFSCYAPTYAASREDKDSFFDTLQQATYLSSAIGRMSCDAGGLQCLCGVKSESG